MKRTRKLFITILFILAAVFSLIGLSGCSMGGTDGTYYLYSETSGSYNKSVYFKLESGEWTDDEGGSGTYQISNGTITFYYTEFGETFDICDGTISDGVLYVMGRYYCKDGKTPNNNSNSSSSGNNNSSSGSDSSSQTQSYTITYNANGGTFADGQTTFSETVNKNVLLTAPTAPTRAYYTFAGWATDKNGGDMWKFDTDKATSNKTLYAVWAQESAKILSVENATISGSKILMLVNSATESVSLSDKVVCSNDSTWKLYYDKLGQMEIPTKIAASISGELVNGDNIFYIVVTSSNNTQTTVYELNIYKSYAVTVSFYDGTELLKTDTAYTGYKYTPNYEPTIRGYTFNGWKYTPQIVWKDLAIYASKTANTYTVTLDTDGGELAVTEKTVTYARSADFGIPTKTGYTFVGWYTKDYVNEKVTDESGKMNGWYGVTDKTLYAKWQANNYTVTLKMNINGGTVTGAGNHPYESELTVTAKTYGGYTWLGWYNGETLLTSELSYTFKIPAESVTYTAKWCKTTITRNDSSAGSVSGLSGTYVPDEETTIIATTNIGYTWLGWYNGETLLTNELSYTFKIPAESVTYTAKWEIAAEMQNFVFSSSENSLSITGIIDKSVTELVIPDSVTSIGDSAFRDCDTLTSVTMPTIAISYIPKTNLKTVVITSGDTIGNYAFRGCSSLTSVTIPDSVTSIGWYAFENCSSLTSVYITDIAAWCNISFGTYSANPLHYAKNLYLNNELVTELVIPDSVTTIGDRAFYNCSSLTSIVIPDSVISIGYQAFSNCSSLTSIDIPDAVTSIGNEAFRGCSALEEITLPFVGASKSATGLESVFGYIFGYTITDKSDTISGATYQYSYQPGVSVLNCHYYIPTSLKKVTIKSGWIRNYAFNNCDGLTSVTIGDSVTSIGYEAFYNCSSLTSIVIPDRVTKIDSYAFSNCMRLVEVYNKSTLNITAGSSVYGNVGYYAKNVYTPTSGESKISTDENGYIIYTDVEDVSLIGYVGTETDLTLPNNITEINKYALYNCNGLTSIVIPDSVITIGDYAFYGCDSLTSIEVSENNTAYQSINGNLYTKDGKKLIQYAIGKTENSFVIPNSVTSIGEYAFYKCSSLTSVVIPNSVTTIGYRAFYGCDSLTSVVIPDRVTTIGNYAFDVGKSLRIYCKANSRLNGWAANWDAFHEGSTYCKHSVYWGYTEE